MCERNSSADVKVSEEGDRGRASGTGADIPLQLMVKTMARQTFPLKRMGVNGGPDIHLRPVVDPTLEHVDGFKGVCDPLERSLSWRWLLARLVTLLK